MSEPDADGYARGEAVEQPVQFLDGQDNGFIGGVWRSFEAFGFEALEPEAEAVALPVQHLDAVTGFIEENEKDGVEHGDFNVQLNQGSETADGLSKIHRLGVEVDFFDFAVGAHHSWWSPERNRERSVAFQLVAWNVAFMERIRR